MNSPIFWSTWANRLQSAGYNVLSRSKIHTLVASNPRRVARAAVIASPRSLGEGDPPSVVIKPSTLLRLAGDERADAVLGEQLQQHAMGHAPIDDHHALDACFHHLDATLDLGDHAAADNAFADLAPRFFDRELLHEPAALVEHARDVGEQ